jgi:hypothetical protein
MPALTGWHYIIFIAKNYFAVSAGFAAGVVAGFVFGDAVGAVL